jgi:hypothetical protein
VNTVMNLRVPLNVGEFLNSWATGGFSRRAQLHGVSYFFSYYRRVKLCRVVSDEGPFDTVFW